MCLDRALQGLTWLPWARIRSHTSPKCWDCVLVPHPAFSQPCVPCGPVCQYQVLRAGIEPWSPAPSPPSPMQQDRAHAAPSQPCTPDLSQNRAPHRSRNLTEGEQQHCSLTTKCLGPEGGPLDKWHRIGCWIWLVGWRLSTPTWEEFVALIYWLYRCKISPFSS